LRKRQNIQWGRKKIQDRGGLQGGDGGLEERRAAAAVKRRRVCVWRRKRC